MSRETKKNFQNKSNKTKDRNIAKLPPFKKDLVHSNDEKKKQFDQEKPKSLEEMMLDIERRQNAFEHEQILNEQDHCASETADGQEKSRKTFYREFKKVIDASDIIIEVLDARDPVGCRCSQVEEVVLTSGKNKKLILLLNKIDLIPRDNLDKWLKYLRNEFPTIAFRSSTQNQRDRLGHITTSIKVCDEHLIKSSNKCIGASTLMNLLSNYCRKNNIKTSITVGIVGFPNVGKSSVINSLKRTQVCQSGSTPGLTKQMQTVKLDKLIKLFDSPGIVMSKDTNPASLILRNCVRIETIDNPLPAIDLLLNRCKKEQMILQYDLTDFQDVNDFLLKMAVKMGSLKKGGVPDIHKAAQRVLSDWNNGKLTYFTEPPERLNEIISTELVTQMKEAFDIDALLNYEEEDLKDLEMNSLSETNQSPLLLPTPADLEMNEEENKSENENSIAEAMDEDDENPQSIMKPVNEIHFKVQAMDKTKRLLKKQTADLVDKQYDDEIRQSIHRSNLTRQHDFKKMKKTQKRSEKSMDSLSDALNSMVRFSSPATINDCFDDE
ncbi:unnamed protein product [Rotaria socialis]|uniref:CP-type G domain-containing protein n=1 Tax=Rotaria socialis TaxID=392032 RepID=A0A817NFZ9_9BILA|nr:unnamed protein product [Rotaria socialis]CAF3326168.1 unnamed protein product [Rotaria socialis]CAF3335073.1 unnamed protein product [Rotaria socialis]CAF3470772.1 unnamed protein product [Rotaria socialis]CAF3494685.1 unnamed protein product [Rotaria socialis]